MLINVIGLGYIGLPTALALAAHGLKVVGTDYNEKLVQTLQSGKTTFEEKDLDKIFKQALDNCIQFKTEYQEADVYIISVPTPYEKENKRIDPTYVVNALKSVLKICPEEAIVVIESTISPGTIDRFVCPIVKKQKKKDN